MLFQKLSEIGNTRYKILNPYWTDEPREQVYVKSAKEVARKTKEIIYEQMAQKSNICTAFDFIKKKSEDSKEAPGYYIIPVVKDYKIEQLQEKVDELLSESEFTAVRMRFEPYYLSHDKKWFIIILT